MIIAVEGIKAARDKDDNDNDPGSNGDKKGKTSFERKASSSSTKQQEWTFEEEPSQHTEANHVDEAKSAISTDEESSMTLSDEEQHPIEENAPSSQNQGTLLVDATCAPADIAYPTDLNLLNEARKKLESIIDTLHEPVIGREPKPCTYREKARKQYLPVSKKRRPGRKTIRKAIGQQLRYVEHVLKRLVKLSSIYNCW